MNPKERSKYEARAAVLKSMAHPTRLYIVEELSGGEHSVRELTDRIGADISTVSKHLSVLRNAGIIRDEKRGAQVFYSLVVPCVLNFFSCVETVLVSRAREQAGWVR